MRVNRIALSVKVLLVAGALCTVLLVIAMVNFLGLRAIDARNQLQRDSILHELVIVNDLVRNAGLMQAEVFGCITSGDKETFDRHGIIILDLEKQHAEISRRYAEIVDIGEEAELFEKVTKNWKNYRQKTAELLDLKRNKFDALIGNAVFADQTNAFWDYSQAVNLLTYQTEREGAEFAVATERIIVLIQILGNILVGLALIIAAGTGFAVAAMLRHLNHDRNTLQEEIGFRQKTEEKLRGQTAFLEAQANASIDGILVVGADGKKKLQNGRLTELWKIPSQVAEDLSNESQLKWVMAAAKNSREFGERVAYLDAHREEVVRDEIELVDGRTFDRFSSPVTGDEGTYYGRIWTFRDITARKRSEHVLGESQARYRTLIESLMEGYACCKAVRIEERVTDFIFLEVNSAYEKLTGLKDVVGKKVSDVMPGVKDAGSNYFDIFERVLSTGKPEKAERFSEALARWFSITVYSQQNDVFVIVFDNITKRKLEEETLRLLNSAVIQSREAIVITDAQFDFPGPKIVFVNTGYTRMSGYREDEVIGNTPRLLQGPKTDRKTLQRMRETLGRGEVFVGEIINYRKTGEEFHMEWQVAPLSNKEGVVTNFVSIQRDITERKLWEHTLRESEERFRALFDLGPFAIYACDALGVIQVFNAKAVELWGRTPAKNETDEHFGRLFKLFHPNGTFIPLDENGMALILAGKIEVVNDMEIVIERPDETKITVVVNIVPLTDGSGNITGAINCFHDITERKRLQAQLLQSQKLETVGKLAGGVAHEFNSILTAIIGQSELILNDLPPDSPLRDNVSEIGAAGNRAAILTGQLLAYGRKQFLRPEVLDLNQILLGMEGMFRHLMGGDIQTKIIPQTALKMVQGDAGQIEQVLVNMAINAREAMPNGGIVTFETLNATIDIESLGRNSDLEPGEYVILAVTDTGRGMTAEVKARVFEPFFSTKPEGDGAGLGLSTCYGIIKQSRGHISVYSEPGQGSTFRIYLPQVRDKKSEKEVPLGSRSMPGGSESILLVEDDGALRKMATTLLQRLGYTVWPAADGIEALSLKQRQGVGHVDLLFTDVNMPHMSGKELAERVGKLYPYTRILFTSAFTENSMIHQGVVDKKMVLLQKPFTPSELAQKIREVLDAKLPLADTST